MEAQRAVRGVGGEVGGEVAQSKGHGVLLGLRGLGAERGVAAADHPHHPEVDPGEPPRLDRDRLERILRVRSVGRGAAAMRSSMSLMGSSVVGWCSGSMAGTTLGLLRDEEPARPRLGLVEEQEVQQVLDPVPGETDLAGGVGEAASDRAGTSGSPARPGTSSSRPPSRAAGRCRPRPRRRRPCRSSRRCGSGRWRRSGSCR